MPRQRKPVPGVDAKLLIKDAGKLLPEPSRRFFLRGAASLGALAMLSGCDIIDGDTSENALRAISTFNDRVQALLFNPHTLAPEYPESMITRPFPFNAYYSEDEAPEVDGEQYQLEIGGKVDNKKPWTLAGALQAAGSLADHPPCLRRRLERHRLLAGRAPVRFPQAGRRRPKRQICLVPVRRGLFEHHRHADRAASADPTDPQIRSQGSAARLRLPDQDPHPTKLGFKNPKYVTAMWVQNNDAGGYWENQGYNWFSGL